MPVRMSVDSKLPSGPLEQRQKLSDLCPVFRLDLMFVSVSLSGEPGKKQLSEGDAEPSRFICQQRNLFGWSKALPLHQVQMHGQMHSLIRKFLQAFIQLGSVRDDTGSVQDAVFKACQDAFTLFKKQPVIIRMELRHRSMIPFLQDSLC